MQRDQKTSVSSYMASVQWSSHSNISVLQQADTSSVSNAG